MSHAIGYAVIADRSTKQTIIATVKPDRVDALEHCNQLNAKARREPHLYGAVTYRVVAVHELDNVA